jgi:tetratricopeptide (TPR) repeat protein
MDQNNGTTIDQLRCAAISNTSDALAQAQLGKALLDREEISDAIPYLRRACELNSAEASHHFQLGRALAFQAEYEAAAEQFDAARRLRPSWSLPYRRLGGICIERLSRWDGALRVFRLALENDLSDWAAYTGLARCCIQGRDSLRARQDARKLAPAAAGRDAIDMGVARALEIHGRYAEALECYTDAARAGSNRSEALGAIARMTEVLGDPSIARSRHKLALQTGDLEHKEAFARYLFRTGEFDFARKLWCETKPEWGAFSRVRGALGRTVLLDTATGGFGDTLQFVRLAAWLKQAGAHTIVQCQASACGLAESVPGVDLAIARHDPRPYTDSVLSPGVESFLLLNTGFEHGNLPPYIKPPTSLQTLWRERMKPWLSCRIGIVWRGSGFSSCDRYTNRTVALPLFRSIAQLPEVTLFSLQKGPGACDVRLNQDIPIVDLTEHIRTFSDAAAAALMLDLVISIDTSVAHLAGACGVPVFLLLPFRCCHRWLQNREDTPWYRSMKLFRQRTPGDWGDVMDRLLVDVKEFAKKREPSV